LGFTETPAVHFTTILSPLTITPTVQRSNALNILKDNRSSLPNRNGDDLLRHIMQDVHGPAGSPTAVLRRYNLSYPNIISLERTNNFRFDFG
jgi:hypothetical protein